MDEMKKQAQSVEQVELLELKVLVQVVAEKEEKEEQFECLELIEIVDFDFAVAEVGSKELKYFEYQWAESFEMRESGFRDQKELNLDLKMLELMKLSELSHFFVSEKLIDFSEQAQKVLQAEQTGCFAPDFADYFEYLMMLMLMLMTVVGSHSQPDCSEQLSLMADFVGFDFVDSDSDYVWFVDFDSEMIGSVDLIVMNSFDFVEHLIGLMMYFSDSESEFDFVEPYYFHCQLEQQHYHCYFADY